MKRRMPKPPSPKTHAFPVVFLLVVILLADLIYLHFSLLKIQKTLFYQSGQVPKEAVNLQNTEGKQVSSCSPSCLTSIQNVQTTLENKINALPQSQTIVQSGGGGGGSAVKEYFVAFGSGTSSSGDWQDVPGLQA